jgi:hypothetical protein
VAPPLNQRLAWPLAAAVALVFLVGLALQGERPGSGLVGFEQGGFLRQLAPEAAQQVEVVSPQGRWLFRRDGAWRAIETATPVAQASGERIDKALRLLRDSRPLRVMTADEVAGQPATSYGLDDKALKVTVRDGAGAVFVIRFGDRNPLGSGRYVSIEGVPGVPIVAAYVGEAWEQVVQ